MENTTTEKAPLQISGLMSSGTVVDLCHHCLVVFYQFFVVFLLYSTDLYTMCFTPLINYDSFVIFTFSYLLPT